MDRSNKSPPPSSRESLVGTGGLLHIEQDLVRTSPDLARREGQTRHGTGGWQSLSFCLCRSLDPTQTQSRVRGCFSLSLGGGRRHVSGVDGDGDGDEDTRRRQDGHRSS
ncbi:hypothetical protein CGCA056_v011582 [Colletotrichum aenigma]|uniref:uncharacterized protein n=1 Tax=Colletotrichum aenigma TaxID=1215731 RepID=UPI001872FB27|nr:uncharacterized protein CGCA056_v011582 [Colletotrichum aenigma]KAF5512133.1 hypothetical protein CGCA056_v011582 [Colletotrichum aenigma]